MKMKARLPKERQLADGGLQVLKMTGDLCFVPNSLKVGLRGGLRRIKSRKAGGGM